ncbi:MAG: biopolymer transporter ExbD [Pirellula sp.]
MSIRFTCASCTKSIVVHDRFENRQVRCPACSFELTVPKRSKTEASNSPSNDAPTVQSETDLQEVSFVESEVVEESLQEATQVAAQEANETHVEDSEPDLARTSPRSIRSVQEESNEKFQWDITPMVDVAFLLLIFFMLTASFSIQKVIRTAPPIPEDASASVVQVQPKNTDESLIVQVDEFNAYTVLTSDGETHEASSKQELVGILKDLRLQFGADISRVIVHAHVDSIHGATVACLDAAREAEFTKFQIFAVESF